MKIINGMWRECTPAERDSLRFVTYQCVVHPGWMGCECARPDCLPRMVFLGVPHAQMFTAEQRARHYTVRDNRRADR